MVASWTTPVDDTELADEGGRAELADEGGRAELDAAAPVENTGRGAMGAGEGLRRIW